MKVNFWIISCQEAMKRTITIVLLLITASLSCTHEPFVAPSNTTDTGLCFDRDILPIFVSQCAKSGCHDKNSHEEGYVLDSYDNIVSKGITKGRANSSRIYEVLFREADDRMPKDAAPLTAIQISLIKRWIDAGATRDTNCQSACDSNLFTFNSTIKPLVNKYCAGCHSGVSPSGNLTLSSYQDIRNAVLNKNLLKSIRYEPGYPGMPNSGIRLSSCEIRQMEKWVEANMPDN